MSAAAFMGESVIGVGVVKGKRAYNMTRRRAIKQGLLPAGPAPNVVSAGEASGTRGAGGVAAGRGGGLALRVKMRRRFKMCWKLW